VTPMKLNLLKRNKEEEQEVKPVERKIKKEQVTETVKTSRSLLQIPGFSQYNALMKLRIIVSTIFLLCTVALVLIFVNEWVISAILLLLGYVMLFFLMLKLFRIKNL
jgi:hypothetical protein